MLPMLMGDSLHSNYHFSELVHDSLHLKQPLQKVEHDSLHTNYHFSGLVHDSLHLKSLLPGLVHDSLLLK